MTLENRSFPQGTTSGNNLKSEVRLFPSGGAGKGEGNDLNLSLGTDPEGTTSGNDLEAGSLRAARVLVADCPWRFGDKLPGLGRGAEKHYATLSVAELCAFPLPPLEQDCHLFFWRVAAMQREALEVIDAWGFVVKTELVWLKRTTNGKRHFGMGRTLRAEHETCLVATRGKPVVKRKDVRSTFEAVAERVHSRKPEAFFELVESLCDGPYVELFARRRRAGWQCFGNELPGETP